MSTTVVVGQAGPEQTGPDYVQNRTALNTTAAKGYGATDEDLPPAELDEHGCAVSGTKITKWQASWNITNAIQGMFVVSLPYAVLHGGWWSVGALIGTAWICYYTGIILVECLYDAQGKRVRHTYREVAEAVWGENVGGRLVLGAQLTELLMTCILYIVLSGDLLESAFPDFTIEKTGWMILTATVLMPCALLKDITAVSTLSFWNTISHLIINAAVMMYCLTRIREWAWSSVAFTFDIHTFSTMLGIIVFSYTDHIFLPTLEGSMYDRTEFKPMMRASHICAAVFKAGFGLIGFLTFADYTQEEIPNNLPSQTWKMLLNVVLVVKALLSYPLPYYATATIIEQNLFLGRPKTALPNAYHPDGQLTEVVQSIANKSIIGTGITFGVFGLIYSSQLLFKALYNDSEYV